MSFENHFLLYARSKKWDTVKAHCEVYSSNPKYSWEGIVPDETEMEEFLGKAAKITNLKTEQVEAIGDIGKWVKRNPVSQLQSVDIHRSAFQMAIRVLWPASLNQGHCGFCGPTSIIFDFLKRYPRTYVKCCTSLIEKKTGRIDINSGVLGFDVELTPVEASDWKKKSLPEVDFILMRAIRKKAWSLVKGSASGGLDFVFTDQDSHATTPWQMGMLLKKPATLMSRTIRWDGLATPMPGARPLKRRNGSYPTAPRS